MSYILEALKRSQQERTLGETLQPEQPAALSDTAVRIPVPLWAWVAITLAILAVLIALYAAFLVPGRLALQTTSALNPAVPGPQQALPVAVVQPPPAPLSESPADPAPEPASRIPADLIAEIEAFKQQVRREQDGAH